MDRRSTGSRGGLVPFGVLAGTPTSRGSFAPTGLGFDRDDVPERNDVVTTSQVDGALAELSLGGGAGGETFPDVDVLRERSRLPAGGNGRDPDSRDYMDIGYLMNEGSDSDGRDSGLGVDNGDDEEYPGGHDSELAAVFGTDGVFRGSSSARRHAPGRAVDPAVAAWALDDGTDHAGGAAPHGSKESSGEPEAAAQTWSTRLEEATREGTGAAYWGAYRERADNLSRALSSAGLHAAGGAEDAKHGNGESKGSAEHLPPHGSSVADGGDGAAPGPAGGAEEVAPWYDAEADDDDERWVKEHGSGIPEALRGQTSDAVLSCPFCFSPLSYLCQRNAVHVNQFRALIVVNCAPRMDEVVSFPTKDASRGSGRGGRRGAARGESSSTEEYHPVACAVCGTEVAVLDEEDVYHFFHVVPS